MFQPAVYIRRRHLNDLMSKKQSLFFKNRRFSVKVKHFDEIPGPPNYPVFLGTIIPFMKAKAPNSEGFKLNELFGQLYENYGSVVKFPPGKKMILTTSSDVLKIFEKEQKNSRGIFDSTWAIHHWNRLNLPEDFQGTVNPFLARGEEWRKGRMAVNPHMFNAKAAKSYLPTINTTSKVLINNIEKFKGDGKFDISHFCKYASLDQFFTIALEHNLNAVGGDPKNLEIADNILAGLSDLSRIGIDCPWSEKSDYLKFGSWKRFEKKYRIAREATLQLLNETIEDPNKSGFIHKFMAKSAESGENNITIEQATEMILILAFAAGDTTSSYMANIIYQLASNIEVQKKLRSEISKELSGGDFEKKTRIRYLDQVLYETQRLTPVLPWQFFRFDTEEEYILDGYKIPIGTNIAFTNVYLRKHIEDAEKFIPERYSQEAVNMRKGTSLEYMDHVAIKLPFSHGARSCVGQRIAKLILKSFICRLVQDYEFKITNQDDTFDHVTVITTIPTPYPKISFEKVKK